MDNKRGEMGTSTLIILIASILVIVSILFSIFSTMDFLVSSSYKNSKLSNNYISKGIHIVSVDAFDGTNEYFDEFYLTVNLLPDSQEIDFDKLLVSVNTKDSSNSLIYRNGTPTSGAGGYESFAEDTLNQDLVADYSSQSVQINPGSFLNLNVDIDGDGNTNDLVATCDSVGTFCDLAYSDVALIFNLSSAGIQYAWLNDTTNSLVDISPAGLVALDISYSPIGDGSYGFISTSGTKVAFQQHVMTPTGPFDIYAQPIALANDIDLDGLTDYIVTNDTDLRIFPSSERVSIDISLGGDISSGSVALSINQDLYLTNGTYIGNIVISGTGSGGIIPDSSIRITPTNSGSGYYQIEYLISASDHLEGRLNRGEVAKIFIDSPQRILPDNEVKFSFIVPEGVTFPVSVFSGHTIRSSELITLYPQI